MALRKGFWAGGVEGTSDNLNAGLISEADALADLPTAAAGNAGMEVFVLATQMLYRSTGSAWEVSGIGSDGTPAQGDIFYFNGTKITRLAADTAGKVLQTNGAGANPTWAAQVAVPIGGIIGWPGFLNVIPAGFHLCDGSAISRTTYATLFGLILTTYGVGDGSTTFNLPDSRDRFIAGTHTGATQAGATGGSLSKTTAGHTHGLSTGVFQIGSYTAANNIASAQDSIPDIRPPFIEEARIIRII